MTRLSAFQAATARWCAELSGPRTQLVPTVTEADCRVIGSGDGSVMVLCRACSPSRCLAPRATTLNAVAGLWEEHVEEAHPPVLREVPAPVPDPWMDPDAAAALNPPPF